MDLLAVQRLIDKIIHKYDFTQTAKIYELFDRYPQFKNKETRIDVM